MLRRSRPLVCLAFLLLAHGCVSDDADDSLGDDDGTETDGDTGDGDGDEDMTGQQLFMTLCSGCHGLEAEGSAIAYELRHPHDDFARWVIRNGRMSIEFQNQMPQFTPEQLSDDELDRILEYLDSFPQPTTPEGLYLDYCRNCHGVDALGGVVGEELTEASLDEFFEKVREGEGGTNYGARTQFMPARTPDELSDAEIEAIFDYVSTL
jgi:mono/diheme cytochrome c family protein